MAMQEASIRPTLAIARALLRIRPDGVPNTADTASPQSKAIAAELIRIVFAEAESGGEAQPGLNQRG